MINRLVPFAILFILSSCLMPAQAQSDLYNGYSIQHFTDDNGLPQNSINDALLDKNGCLWLGSQFGLVKFNGKSFKLYYPDDKPAMETNVVAVGSDYLGSVYFQTDDHNLYCYAGNNSHLLRSVNTGVHRRPALLDGRKQFFDFTSFLEQGSVGAKEEKENIFHSLSIHPSNFFVVDSNRLYLIYNDCLYYYDGRQLQKLTEAMPDAGSLQYLLRDGRFFILDKNLIRHCYNEGRQISGRAVIGGDLAGDAAVLHLTMGSFHLFSSEKADHLIAGKRMYRLTTGPNGEVRADFLLSLDFVGNISAVEYEPALDLLIICCVNDGFYLLQKSKFQVNGWPAPLRQHASGYLFGPLALHHDKEIMTSGFIFDAAGKFRAAKDSTPLQQRCLYIDKKDQVWSSIYNRPRLLTSTLAAIRAFPSLDANIVDFTEDDSGHLYCLTEKSLWLLQTESFRRLSILYLPGPVLKPSRGDNESFCLVDSNRLWIANVNGLLEYNLNSGGIRSVPSLAGSHVRAIHLCKDRSVLLGTYGQGYFYYHNGLFTRMPLDKGGFLITAHGFLEDEHGSIWIPTNKGLFKAKKTDLDAWAEGKSKEIAYYYFGKKEGLQTNEFNGGFNSSGLITSEGFVSLLSMKGMVCFYADSLRVDFPRAPVEINVVENDGKQLTGNSDTIHLDAGYRGLSLEISCSYLGNSNNLCLEYNVAGLNEDWKEVRGDGLLSLNRLEPGHYLLRVRRLNGFGIDNYRYAQIHIVVAPIFYKTVWFVILAICFLITLLTILALLRWQLVKKKREIRVKTEKLEETVGILKQTVVKLQESETALLHTNKLREKLISLVIHDLRSPLRFLTMLAGDLHDNQTHFSADEMKERSYLIKKGSQDIYNFSEDFLLWVTSQKDNFTINRKLFSIRPMLREIYDFFSDQVRQNGNTMSYETEDHLQIYSDPHILITILRNLTDNANKYTSNGNIELKAIAENGFLVFSVSDSGRGMSNRQMDAFLQNGNLEDVKSGSQLGHRFIADLTQRINGILSIASVENEGTTVTVRFPVGAQ